MASAEEAAREFYIECASRVLCRAATMHDSSITTDHLFVGGERWREA